MSSWFLWLLKWAIIIFGWFGPRELVGVIGLVLLYLGVSALHSPAAGKIVIGGILIWLAIPPVAKPPTTDKRRE